MIAKEIGINQNTYSYWESGKVRVDDASMAKLAALLNVSVDFLSGKRFRITNPLKNWHKSLQDDYSNAEPYEKEYMEYLYGKPVFGDGDFEILDIESEKGKKIPVYGLVAAGIPIEAITDIEDYEEITEELARTGEFAALKIHGDSMEPRMTEGDVVIVRIQETVESGDTAIVMINGDEATCKKIKKTPEGIMLISTNPAYEPMFYSNKQIEELPIRIFGKVVELRGKF